MVSVAVVEEQDSVELSSKHIITLVFRKKDIKNEQYQKN